MYTDNRAETQVQHLNVTLVKVDSVRWETASTWAATVLILHQEFSGIISYYLNYVDVNQSIFYFQSN